MTHNPRMFCSSTSSFVLLYGLKIHVKIDIVCSCQRLAQNIPSISVALPHSAFAIARYKRAHQEGNLALRQVSGIRKIAPPKNPLKTLLRSFQGASVRPSPSRGRRREPKRSGLQSIRASFPSSQIRDPIAGSGRRGWQDTRPQSRGF